MSEDKLEFLGGAQPAEPDPLSQGAPTAPEDGGPQKGPDGRYLTAVPVTGSGGPGESPQSRPREDGHVPISALLDEREKRQAERAQREALERRVAEMAAQALPPRELAPAEHIEVALYSQNLRASRRFAEREYGKDAIAGIHDWATRRCDDDPIFNQQMRSSDDPYEAAVQAYNREQILRTVKPDDLAAFKAWQASSASGARATHDSVPTHRSTSRASVPRSLATASGTGGAGAPHVPIGPGLAFATAINR
jgi:hypothetical protein